MVPDLITGLAIHLFKRESFMCACLRTTVLPIRKHEQQKYTIRGCKLNIFHNNNNNNINTFGYFAIFILNT